MSMSVCPVNVSVRNSTGLLELNRPKALNSLNPRMVDLITDALEKWADDPDVHRVIIYSSSPKAFCAGGDVRLVREEITGGSYKAGDKFFLDEYEMNNALANFPKPVVALIDGVAMGGGLGISAHGSHRVITENALAAMPEMVIGFSPDVGMTWMMARMGTARRATSASVSWRSRRIRVAPTLREASASVRQRVTTAVQSVIVRRAMMDRAPTLPDILASDRRESS